MEQPLEEEWYSPPIDHEINDLPEVKSNTYTLINTEKVGTQFHIFDKISSLIKLKRVTALCLRFIKNCKLKQNKETGNLTVDNLNEAMERLICCAQSELFKKEMEVVDRCVYLQSNDKLAKLTPFLDDKGILRVGGRLHNCEHLTFTQKHPILLSAYHYFVMNT